MKKKNFFISNDILKKTVFGELRPLSGKRVTSVIGVSQAMGWMKKSDISVIRAASFNVLSSPRIVYNLEAELKSVQPVQPVYFVQAAKEALNS